MTVERILYARTEDGITHAGMAIRPDSASGGRPAVVWVHGFTGSFHEPHAVHIGRLLAQRGYTFVAGDNRGHDVGAAVGTSEGLRPVGAAWEDFSESPRDIAAWIDVALSLGFEQVVLLGHSLGALKAAYYLAQRPDRHVAGLILASPPARPRNDDPALTARAMELVAAGQGRALLLPWERMPAGRIPVSAHTYLASAEPMRTSLDPASPDAAIAQVRCPVLALYGSEEPRIGGADSLEQIRAAARAAQRVDTLMIEGADHVYTGHETDVAMAVAEWLDRLPVPTPTEIPEGTFE